MKKLILMITIILTLCVVGCDNMSNEPSSLPANAQIINDLGNGWVIFEVNDMKFLYHKRGAGYKGFEAITQIDRQEGGVSWKP